MAAIDFVVRTSAGAVRHGKVLGSESNFSIVMDEGQELSLNMDRLNVGSYSRIENDLLITLADGRVIVLENYFVDQGVLNNQLYLSAGNEISEISFTQGKDGALYGTYTDIPNPGKWGPLDPLVFIDDPIVATPTQMAAAGGEDVSMLAAAGLFGGGGLSALGIAGAAAAGVAVAAASGSSDGDGDGNGGAGGGTTPQDPSGATVNDPTSVQKVNAAADKSLDVSGTGVPGSTVAVTIAGITQTTTVDENGSWTTNFSGENFPPDGNYESEVAVTEPSGNTINLDGPGFHIDTVAPDINATQGVVSANHVFNQADHADGVEIGGTGEPGATVEVKIGDATKQTVVNSDGTWTVVFATNEVAGGEYTQEVSVTATDSFGNSATITDKIQVDTQTQIDITAPIETDNVVNKVEASDGVTIRGSSEAGASKVEVTFGNVTKLASVAADGTWEVTFAPGEIPGGTYEATITAKVTDAAGNTASDTHKINVDTEVAVSVEDDNVETDGIINAAEAIDGVVLTGATDPGSTVAVTFNGQTLNANVDAAGGWSVTFPANAIPTGETVVAVSALATDAAGNQSTATGNVDVDTLVNSLAISNNTVAQDNNANAEEIAGGLDVNGVVEIGSSVIVTYLGKDYAAEVDANGNWTATIPESEFQIGEYQAKIDVTATDKAGNTKTIEHSFDVDTLVPDPAKVTAVTIGTVGEGYRAIITEDDSPNVIGIHEQRSDGNITALSYAADTISSQNEIQFSFDSDLPDGSNLIVTASDNSGNSFGSYVALNKTGNMTVNVDANALSQYEIAAIDLEFAENAHLTLTESQLLQLSSITNEVKIYGDANDKVTILGAQKLRDEQKDGHSFDVYQLGADGEVWVEDDIANVVI